MKRLIVLLPLAVTILSGCWSGQAEKQWYKPNVEYTAADFERDRAACTDQKKVLDEACMKQRGWATLGADITPAAKPPDPTKSPAAHGRY